MVVLQPMTFVLTFLNGPHPVSFSSSHIISLLSTLLQMVS
jgi:hypothetical protein